MIAMQYSFVLPADYDMTIIDRRIREKGPLLDGFPHLRFKAYLSARKQNDGFASFENLYSPFYLWDTSEGIDRFLSSTGFATLTRDFGWPVVRTWMIWHADLHPGLRTAKFARREIVPIAPHSDFASQRNDAVTEARSAIHEGATAAIAAFSPTEWTAVQFSLWDAVPQPVSRSVQTYAVGHLSLPKSQ
ncbi:DUF4865 family protein [Ensifer sp. ENS06]|uniref:DUF4865 family protein n=1 Tax=Ensifer sp. ENS06 TaxID=2769276 RepID=UPI000DDECB29|nr:DUF4865 family protein [Ensifer sp. ENS06]MBD9626334.1 DUF4865 family protein [Ensifer sp. ENS06]